MEDIDPRDTVAAASSIEKRNLAIRKDAADTPHPRVPALQETTAATAVMASVVKQMRHTSCISGKSESDSLRQRDVRPQS